MREENIFYRLTSDNEDATTELLCNLCRFEEFKKVIFDTLNINNDHFSYNDINTQYVIPRKNKRPDIIIENMKTKIFIENKIFKHRRLGKSQLTEYPKYLKSINDKEIKLIYLVPKGYKYYDSIINAKQLFNFISITYWDDLLENMQEKNQILKSELLTESIVFFKKILNTIPEINYTGEEIKIMTDLKQLVFECTVMGKTLELFSNVIEQLVDKLGLKIKRGYTPSPEISENGLGYYFYNENCYLGYSFGFIEDALTKDYVFSLAIHNEIVSKTKLKNIDYSFITDEAYHYFKIDLKWSENEKHVKELYQYCEKYMKGVVKNIN